MKNLAKHQGGVSRKNYGLPHLFNDIFNNDLDLFLANDHHKTIPAINIAEADTGFTIELLAPGMHKENFELSVESNKLTVTGTVKESSEKEVKVYKRREFKTQGFKRHFTLPDNASLKKIDAAYSNGVLEITIPKLTKQEKGFRKISIS